MKKHSSKKIWRPVFSFVIVFILLISPMASFKIKAIFADEATSTSEIITTVIDTGVGIVSTTTTPEEIDLVDKGIEQETEQITEQINEITTDATSSDNTISIIDTGYDINVDMNGETISTTTLEDLLNLNQETEQQAPKPKPVIPRKRFTPRLEGQPIKTLKKSKPEGIKENTEINVEILPESEQEESKILLRGACQKKYFVVLMYANPNDYVKDPALFIYNKAFPCQNGAYQYKLDDLPEQLSAGIYYFLVGEQGETGTWQPITAIQPVRIIRIF